MEDKKWEALHPRPWASMTLREQGTLMIGMDIVRGHSTPTVASMIAIIDLLVLWYGLAREQLYEATFPDVMELIKRAIEGIAKPSIGMDAETWLNAKP